MKRLLLKIGGGATINVPAVVKDLATAVDLNQTQVIIIHGANAVRDELMQKLGQTRTVITSVSGYDSVLSDEAVIDAQMMAYAGLQNKRIVELCQQSGIDAVGLSGVDGKLIQGQRTRGIRAKVGEGDTAKVKIIRDRSGKPKAVNAGLLELLLSNSYTPVLCVPIIDENGVAINSENDDIINVLQAALPADTIMQLIEAPGFLDDKDDETSLVRAITQSELEQREAQVSGRMKRKMLALRKLFESGATTVHITDGRGDTPITDALNGAGTVIR